jgi:type II secretory pathway pseudopilin PulG
MKTVTRSALATLLLAVLPAVSRAVSDDSSLNESMQQYRQLLADRGAWHNPYLPGASASDSSAAAQPTESGDEAVARIVAQYSRAELDRGGWENRFMPSAAAGNPIVATQVQDGVTSPAGEQVGVSGDELLMRSVSAYTRAALDRGGWENPFVPDTHYAAGNALLAVGVREGVTTVASVRDL